MTFNGENIPQELRDLPRWVGWKYGKARADGKRPKLPINASNGRDAKSNDPATWATFLAAVEAVARLALEGVGFVLGDGYAGVDFDECIVGGKVVPQVVGVLGVFNSYAEISPSQTGIKQIVKGRKPEGAGCQRRAVLGCKQVEIYDTGRYFTITSQRVPGTPGTVENRQAELTDLCNELWPKTAEKQAVTVCQNDIPSSAVSQLGGNAQAGALDRCWRCILAMRESVSGEGGHDALLAAACTCFRFALDDGQALQILQRFNAERCRPQWDEAAIVRKLSEARKKVEADGQWGELLRKGHKGTGKAKRRWHNALPEWILEIRGLRPNQRVILQEIANKCDRHPIDAAGSLGTAIVGFETLAELCGIGERTVTRQVKMMLAAGLLVRVRKGGINFVTGEMLANEYQIPGKFGALDGVSTGHTVPSPSTGLLMMVCQRDIPSGGGE